MRTAELKLTVRDGDKRLLVSALIPQFTEADLREKGEVILMLANLYLKEQHKRILRRTLQ
jgi:hypothetical protein